ncbi:MULTISPECIES: type II toxin-antitoxin system RelE/ParE family toxin [Rhizobium]|uniref:Type II toxin-antitoxin system RelE/ParE family toxin n=1 Tax=Rhizobium rhododendri TaxID=2506430 RepID=A0ABY8IE31_9HYPH|nr:MULTISPECIES: type II toxin-antitoxin system RelE/ParE family toxin [Rhizobium]MBZ5759066.1 type II toxin-antitoxin system RelE/ParE family toxin [Rhizobium sp. VS19-DR96]MBZ5764104.1 type II toxin-antitoxin system RelE/ParE family toxin [Rhizobium sp. VS19-DR129.2]MBZ5771647.1 type II toxin-antitoxin system RelE/ParE family toxin [Rhizobium sp. VS19-DRK62.2]MBZ5783666.1 type II toxin-antitoxin system RelE/ParE family toxin [Rhizobium sp. VS19-DR121]MBZ5801660.1 type II toxin-antitoxin syst
MNIIWAEAAVADLVAIRAFIADHNPQAANKVAAKILHAANLLRDKPRLGLSTHVAHVRRLIVHQSPYSIIYRVVGPDLQILEIFDGRQLAPRTDVRG